MSYKIDLHMHTCSTPHAYSTLEEMISRAIKKNMEVIAITNHGPAAADSPHWWSLKNMKVIPPVVDGLRILKGVEANVINSDGSIDINDAIYKVMDIILAGFHTIESYGTRDDVQKNTNALLDIFKKGYVDIITHPGNPDFPIDMKTIVHAAKEYGVALEMNNSSFCNTRIGSAPNCEKMLKLCKENGNTISLGSDAHISYDIGNFEYIEKLLEKYDYPKELIINSNQHILDEFIKSRKKLKPKNYSE